MNPDADEDAVLLIHRLREALAEAEKTARVERARSGRYEGEIARRGDLARIALATLRDAFKPVDRRLLLADALLVQVETPK